MFTIKTDIPKQRVQDLLVGALEGGSNYWYTIDRYILPTGVYIKDFREGGKFTDPFNYYHFSQIVPFTEGCSVVFLAEDHPAPEGKEWVLNIESMQHGLDLMAEKYPGVFSDFINENDDAETSDIFLQLCLFGELIFG